MFKNILENIDQSRNWCLVFLCKYFLFVEDVKYEMLKILFNQLIKVK